MGNDERPVHDDGDLKGRSQCHVGLGVKECSSAKDGLRDTFPRSSPRYRMNSRDVKMSRKRLSARTDELSEEPMHLYSQNRVLEDCGTSCGVDDAEDTPSTAAYDDTPSTTVSSRCSSPRKRRETHPAASPVRRGFSKSRFGAWEDDVPANRLVNLASSPRRRRVHQRYMRLQPMSCPAGLIPVDLESEGEDGSYPMVYKIQSEPPTPASKFSLDLSEKATPKLQVLRGLREDVEDLQEKPARGPAQRRRESFHSLGSHVDWKTLLDYAGDCPEAWSARKVHRWLGMCEKDAFVFLMELLELREALNKGEAPEMQAGPENSMITTPREPTVTANASSSRGWMGWMFGGSTVQAPTGQAQPQQASGGFFSWLFLGGSPAQRVPSTVKPMRLQHTDVVEYQLDELLEVGLLGRGAFGQVTLVRCQVTGQLLALKAISKGMLVEMQLQQSVLIEKAVMQATCNPFLVKMAATFNRQDTLYLLLEAVMGGDLYTVYRRYNYFGSEEHAMFYAACAVCGFEHLHKNRILYRDLKMENLVLDLRGYCKLCDFGTASFDFGAAYTMCGTPEYMPPEVVCGTGHGPAADWWTLGVLIYEMVMAVTPFAEDQPLQIFAKAKAGIDKVEGFNELDTTWSDLVRGLCRQEPGKRLPMLEGGSENVRGQAWFAAAGFDWKALEAGRMTSPHVPQCTGPEDLCNFAGEEQEVPLNLPYVDPGDSWDKNFEDPVGPRSVILTDL